MPRLFNIEVFNQSIGGDATTAPFFYTDRDHMALLGSADTLLAQVIVEGTTDATGTVTVTYQFSNTGRDEDWQTAANSATVTPGQASSIPTSAMYAITSTSELGAFGRYRIKFNKTAVATVRIVVCGHSNG